MPVVADYMNNKVRIQHVLQGSEPVGLTDPQVDMVTNRGPILAIDSTGDGFHNLLVTVGVGSGDTPRKFYAQDLTITYSAATGDYGYPDNSGDIVCGRSTGLLESGVPSIIGTGMAFMSANGIQVFGR